MASIFARLNPYHIYLYGMLKNNLHTEENMLVGEGGKKKRRKGRNVSECSVPNFTCRTSVCTDNLSVRSDSCLS